MKNVKNNVETQWTLNVAPAWVPDSNAAACKCCDAAFSLTTRRHHCRNCGEVVCSSCSQKFIALPQFGITEPVRVCKDCFPSRTDEEPGGCVVS
eukprot:CAMPEP_0177650528 /NCGR_PEP_ID=MMETSP0447-20121125/11992_1 /TAXON_ID=0 /ORGANISM="Stygamoeba regulata, Strain BSH-02190019" /LENGTH=93 /DNA_ID=CAMNT_0019153407 /DNA_START=412 /DNA_END=693 /DNA_ORIENTATION=+